MNVGDEEDGPDLNDEGESSDKVLRAPDLFHRTSVRRRGQVVVKEMGPWAATVRSLLRHLESVGFAWSPRLAEPGSDRESRDTLTYFFVEGELVSPGQWSLEGAAMVGWIVRELHEAASSYRPPPDAVWKPWFGRDLGGRRRVVGHCDVASWNVVVRDGLPVALVDWEVAGPVGRSSTSLKPAGTSRDSTTTWSPSEKGCRPWRSGCGDCARWSTPTA